ncbi:MAG: hypothetical protein ABIP27_07710 [Flavobacterium circumlabens]|uniref:hypothetical protein n=1 Tax=Flavobacterium TaxID=237 RepID=UPI0013D27DCD|nr:hypothetical protein [Flavobacterium fluviatile]
MAAIKNISAKGGGNITIAFLLSILIPAIGYYYLGTLYALFAVGYLGGFIFWLYIPSRTKWPLLRAPFWSTMFAFLFLHKVEENRMNFFKVVSEKITGGTVPEISLGLVAGMLVLPIGIWLSIPLLIKRRHELGYFAIWTLFISMGFTELAHFYFPFLINGPYKYFPGMASVVVLAPLAWWGIWRLIKKT